MTHRLVLIALLGASIVACEASYRAPDPGLIENPRFLEQAAGKGIKSPWIATLHGGQSSFRFSSEDGVLTVEKFGPEPWGQIAQPISAEALKGRTVEFSVDLAGELGASDGSRVNPWQDQTGLSVLIKGYPEGRPNPMMGKTILVDARTDPGLAPGLHEWRRHSLRFQVPKGATDIQVAIRMTRNGVLKVRGPSLTVVE